MHRFIIPQHPKEIQKPMGAVDETVQTGLNDEEIQRRTKDVCERAAEISQSSPVQVQSDSCCLLVARLDLKLRWPGNCNLSKIIYAYSYFSKSQEGLKNEHS